MPCFTHGFTHRSFAIIGYKLIGIKEKIPVNNQYLQGLIAFDSYSCREEKIRTFVLNILLIIHCKNTNYAVRRMTHCPAKFSP